MRTKQRERKYSSVSKSSSPLSNKKRNRKDRRRRNGRPKKQSVSSSRSIDSYNYRKNRKNKKSLSKEREKRNNNHKPRRRRRRNSESSLSSISRRSSSSSIRSISKSSSVSLPSNLRSDSSMSRSPPRRGNNKKIRDKYYSKTKQRKDPLSFYKRKYVPVYENQDPSKTALYWDGFKWVKRINTMKNKDPNFLSQTKKDRRIEIKNVPLYMGLDKVDLKKILHDYIIKNYLNDKGNKEPILGVDVDTKKKSVIVELSCVEEAHRLFRLSFIELLGIKCKLLRVSESLYGNESHTVNKLQMAQVS